MGKFMGLTKVRDLAMAYQLPPPPPPKPPPEDPPPELLLLDGELTMLVFVLLIALEKDFEN